LGTRKRAGIGFAPRRSKEKKEILAKIGELEVR
jgi:hypothetical protein